MHARHEGLGAQHVEAAVRLAQLEGHFIAAAEQMPHRGHLAAHRVAHTVVHRAGTEVLGPRHAQAAEIDVDRLEK
ncbi:hypothetical protein D3C78_1350160 [compost metagenome]